MDSERMLIKLRQDIACFLGLKGLRLVVEGNFRSGEEVGVFVQDFGGGEIMDLAEASVERLACQREGAPCCVFCG